LKRRESSPPASGKDGAVEDVVGHAGLPQQAGEAGQRFGEGRADEDLVAPGHDVPDEGDHGGDLRGVEVGATGFIVVASLVPLPVDVPVRAAHEAGTGGIDRRLAQGLELDDGGGHPVFFYIFGVEVVAEDLALPAALGDVVDLADLVDDAGQVLLAPGDEDGAKQLPEAVDVADAGQELAKPLVGALAVGGGGPAQVELGDHELSAEGLLLRRVGGVGPAFMGQQLSAGGPPRQPEDVGQPVLDRGAVSTSRKESFIVSTPEPASVTCPLLSRTPSSTTTAAKASWQRSAKVGEWVHLNRTDASSGPGWSTVRKKTRPLAPPFPSGRCSPVSPLCSAKTASCSANACFKTKSRCVSVSAA
jgi:hypothetical protein